MKYIDVEKLKAEIERQQKKLCVLSLNEDTDLRRDAAIQNGVYVTLLAFLDNTIEDKTEDIEEKLDFAEYLKALWEGERKVKLDELINFWWVQEDGQGNKMIDTKEHFLSAMKKAYSLGLAQSDMSHTRKMKCIGSLQQEHPEVDLEKIVKSYFDIGHLDVRITTNGDGLLRFARHISRLVRDASFKLYNESSFGNNSGDIDSEIEATIKMNDLWGDLLPSTLIQYTAYHFYKLGLKAGKEEKK